MRLFYFAPNANFLFASPFQPQFEMKGKIFSVLMKPTTSISLHDEDDEENFNRVLYTSLFLSRKLLSHEEVNENMEEITIKINNAKTIFFSSRTRRYKFAYILTLIMFLEI